MKLKTNKLLTLTLATGLVAMTAGCGGSKTPAATGGGGNNTTGGGTADTATYSDWSDSVTIADDDTDNAFLAGVAAVAATGGAEAVAATLTGLPSDASNTTAGTLNLRSEVTALSTTSGATKGLNALTLGGVDGATNGVAFATTGTGDDARFVAGVLAGTDLGAPLTATTVTGDWAGLFQAVGADAVRKAFTLTVTFSASGDDTISALIPVGADAVTAGAMSYFISGTYNAAGVITGNVLYGDFSAADNDADARTAAAGLLTTATGDTPTDPQTVGLGALSGLIGANGAVGAFHSSGSDGEGASGFAGGFVASKADDLGGDDPDAVYADWSGSATLVTAITANGFAAGSPKGFSSATLTGTPTTLDLNDLYEEGEPAVNGDDTNRAGTNGTEDRLLPGADTDGVAFHSIGTGTGARFFAGLHSTTDLGAPIDADSDLTGTWNGLFQAVGAAGYAVSKTFVLTVTFDADGDNTIVGFVPVGADTFTNDGDDSYYLSGTYDENGVITGNILYGDFATGNALGSDALTAAALALTTATATTGDPSTVGLGVLSGLISETEAVGAFHSSGSDGTGVTGYAGGFVSTNATIAAAVGIDATAFDPISFADWTGSFTNPALPAAAVSLAAGTAPTTNAFVHGVAAGLSLPSAITTVALGLDSGSNLDGAATDGVAFGTSGTSTTQFYVAGVLDGTDLGGPLTMATAGGTWNGRFQAVGAAATHTTAVKDFILSVNFGTTTITASIPAGDTNTTVVNNPAYHIDAEFNAATGIITGNIIYATTATAVLGVGAAEAAVAATAGGGTVTGLIGTQGAVGAFISTNTTDGTGALGYAGGFVANN